MTAASTTADPDSAHARNIMVDGQLRPNKVTDPRVIAAMRRLPREAFVPQAHRALAYAEAEAPVRHGRVLIQPVTVARLIQAAAAGPIDHVLVLGAGYAAAVFAALGARVTVVEDDAVIRDEAGAAYAACGVAVTCVEASLPSGWPQGAPYDVIFIDGAVPALPPLGAQLRHRPPGRLCGIEVGAARNGVAVIAEAAGDGLAARTQFDCAATLLPQFRAAPAFVF